MKKEVSLTTNTIKGWNYEDAVKTCREQVTLFYKVTLDLVRELYSAQQVLSNPGFRVDLADGTLCQAGTKSGPKTFKDFLEDIGIPRRTAYNWLALYLPEEDRLMSTEEFKQRLIDHYEALIAQLDARYPSFRPEGWDDRAEAYWQKKQKIAQLQQLASRPVSELVGPQPSLFDDSFLDSLRAPSSEEIVRFGQLKTKAEAYVVPGVDEHQQIKALSFIEATVRQFPAQSRRDIIRSLASMMLEILLNEEDF